MGGGGGRCCRLASTGLSALLVALRRALVGTRERFLVPLARAGRRGLWPDAGDGTTVGQCVLFLSGWSKQKRLPKAGVLPGTDVLSGELLQAEKYPSLHLVTLSWARPGILAPRLDVSMSVRLLFSSRADLCHCRWRVVLVVLFCMVVS